MAHKLTQNLNSSYIEAMNRLNGKQAKKKIVAYVESFDDVFFWSNLLRELETDHYYFEVLLPSRDTLCKGKKKVLSNELGSRLGRYMIACVDADLDYLMQGSTPTSKLLNESPYIFHTYVYAIESFQCYAPALHNVCVMSTLNDRHVFDFEAFLRSFSQTIWNLFVWNVWCYRYGCYKHFTMADFYKVVEMKQIDLFHPERTLELLRHRANAKMARLQHQFPQGKKTFKPLRDELLQLGLSPETCYIYMRGHDLFDGIVAPLVNKVCEILRREREKEIRLLAVHSVQKQNELSSYQHSVISAEEALKRHTSYTQSEAYKKIQADIRQLLRTLETPEETNPDNHPTNP